MLNMRPRRVGGGQRGKETLPSTCASSGLIPDPGARVVPGARLAAQTQKEKTRTDGINMTSIPLTNLEKLKLSLLIRLQAYYMSPQLPFNLHSLHCCHHGATRYLPDTDVLTISSTCC